MNFAHRVSNDPIDILIEGWGRMGMHWGVGKVMGEIQALLYLHRRPLSLEDMSERLKTSRSNISLNVRALQDLGVVEKAVVPGDRKDYYTAEQNVALVARRLAAQKKKRELDPAMDIVSRALQAADTQTPAGSPEHGKNDVDIERLRNLERLMQSIGAIFDAFIRENPPDAGRHEAGSP